MKHSLVQKTDITTFHGARSFNPTVVVRENSRSTKCSQFCSTSAEAGWRWTSNHNNVKDVSNDIPTTRLSDDAGTLEPLTLNHVLLLRLKPALTSSSRKVWTSVISVGSQRKSNIIERTAARLMGFWFVCTPNTTLAAPFLYFELLRQSAVDSCHTCVPFTCISPLVWAQCQTFSVTFFWPCLYLTYLPCFSPCFLSDVLSGLLSWRQSARCPPGFPLSDLLNSDSVPHSELGYLAVE